MVPIFSRKTLRQSLSRDHLADLTLLAITASFGSYNFLDNRFADATFTADSRFERAWGRLFQSSNVAAGNDFRVATFNAASGAFVSAQLNATSVPSGAEVEIHRLMAPSDKDRAIDEVVRRLLVRQEVGLPSVDGVTFYSIDGAASPHRLAAVLNVYYFANPTGSLTRDQRYFDWTNINVTATGVELRVQPAINGSNQIILDAVLQMTLGASEVATINLPDADWLLTGAAAAVYDRLAQDAPRHENDFRRLRREKVVAFAQLTQKYAPPIDRKIQFDDPW